MFAPAAGFYRLKQCWWGDLGAPSSLRTEVSRLCIRPSPWPFLHRGAVLGGACTTPAPRARGWHREPRHQARGIAPRREHTETSHQGEGWRQLQPGLLPLCSARTPAALPCLLQPRAAGRGRCRAAPRSASLPSLFPSAALGPHRGIRSRYL